MRDSSSARLTAEPGPSDSPPDEPHDDEVYVHFGDATHLPMLTLGYANRAAAKRAVAQSLAEGWPARLA